MTPIRVAATTPVTPSWSRNQGLVWDTLREVGQSAQCLRGCQEVRFGRRTYRLKPSAYIHLSMGFTAVVPYSRRDCRFSIPFDNREVQISALNHKPVNGIAGHCSADFTTEFAYHCHEFPYCIIAFPATPLPRWQIPSRTCR
jgi:hypothetical protein